MRGENINWKQRRADNMVHWKPIRLMNNVNSELAKYKQPEIQSLQIDSV